MTYLLINREAYNTLFNDVHIGDLSIGLEARLAMVGSTGTNSMYIVHTLLLVGKSHIMLALYCDLKVTNYAGISLVISVVAKFSVQT